MDDDFSEISIVPVNTRKINVFRHFFDKAEFSEIISIKADYPGICNRYKECVTLTRFLTLLTSKNISG